MSDDLKFLIEDEVLLGTRIKVVGVGGGGSNAVARMMQEGLTGPEFLRIEHGQAGPGHFAGGQQTGDRDRS